MSPISTEEQLSDLIRRVKTLEVNGVRMGVGTLSAANPNTQLGTVTLPDGSSMTNVPVAGNYIPEAQQQVPFILNGNQPIVFAPTQPIVSAAPAQVTGVSTSPGIGSLVVRWAAIIEADVKWNRGYYQVQVDTVNTFDSVNLKSVDAPGTSCTITDLVAGTLYYIRVRAIDYVGTAGAWSATDSETPALVAESDVDFSITGIEVVSSLPAFAGGAITFGAASTGTITGTSPLTFSHTIGSGANRLLVVGVEQEATALQATTSVTYNGVAMTHIITADNTAEAAFQRVQLFYMLEAQLPAAGTYNVVVTLAGNPPGGGVGAGAISVADAAQQPPEATNSSNTAVDNTVHSTNITTLTNGAWVFDVIGEGTGVTHTADAGQTERVDQQGGAGGQAMAMSHETVATAGSATLGWTFSVSVPRICHALAAFAAAGTGYPEGTVVFLTTDDKLYRSTGSAWTAAVPAVDITGQITSTQITDDAITTPKIAANAVTAAEIAANTITSGQIAANTITAGQIQAATITSTEIAANTIQAGDIAANTITAGQIAANTLTAAEIGANAITTSELNADSVTAAKLAALNLEVGKYLRSTTYTAGVTGWTINADGFAEFGNVLVRGIVEGTFVKGSTMVGVIGSNLITNPGAETNTTGWTATNCTLTRTTTAGQFRAGVAAFNLQCTTGGTDMSMHTPTGTSGFAVQPSVSYSVNAFFRSAVTSRKCRIDLRIYDASGALINTYSAEYDDYVNHWRGVQVSSAGPLSANARFASVLIAIEVPATNEQHRVDDIRLFASSTIFTDIETGPSGAPRVSVYSDIVPQILMYNGTDGEAASQIYATNSLNGQDVDRKILNFYSGYPSGGTAATAATMSLQSAGIDSSDERIFTVTADRQYFYDTTSTTVGMVHEECTTVIAASNSTTSTLPAEPANQCRVAIRKRHTESHLLIRAGMNNVFITGGLGAAVELGVDDLVTYHTIARTFINTGTPGNIHGMKDIYFNTIAGGPPWDYTFRILWATSTQTVNTDGNSSYYLSVMECSP